jgi:hypothetical protein
MKPEHSDMTATALAAYYNEGMTNPHLFSSPMWFAFEAGVHMRQHGATGPRKVKMSRGYSVRAETAANTYVLRFTGRDFERCELDRAA